MNAMANVSRRVAQHLTMVLLLLFAMGIAAAGRAEAQPAQTFGADHWLIYGTAHSRTSDGAVPGRGVVAVQPRTEAGEPWSSAAGMIVPGTIASGERVTAVFWARAARACTG